ncbi:hypothetical protein [Halomarina ordinaria]|uniref:DUF8118 domain-containing protein n=1 Tax=Halomarina ordinaria TaxID=3033939 RepID=A0ABD5U950_9EURY|nr:hypothetical protein [Halomarina sp. PSRA2]
MTTDHLRRAPPGASRRPTDRERRPAVSGPHPGYDRYGRLDHYYWRCERCGLEATDAALERRCPRCGGDDA